MACGWHVTYGVFAVEFSNEMEDRMPLYKQLLGGRGVDVSSIGVWMRHYCV